MKKNNSIGKRSVVLLVLCSLILTTVSCTTATQRDTGTNGSRGYIQNLINAAAPGDTILIPTGTYYETLVIDKEITLIGEDKETTIIDGLWGGTVVTITPWAYDVTMQGFTIRNSNVPGGIGVDSMAQHTVLTDNIITTHHGSGIRLYYTAGYNEILSNTIVNNGNGISADFYPTFATIAGNTISNNNNGVYLLDGNEYTIRENTIAENTNYGLYIEYFVSTAHIYHNNFLSNGQNAYSSQGTWHQGYSTPFDPLTDGGNYWSDYTGVDLYQGPNQNIPGSDGIGDTSYSIAGGSRKDQYPFMEPWTGIPPDVTPPQILHHPVEFAALTEDFVVYASVTDDQSASSDIVVYLEYQNAPHSIQPHWMNTIKMEYTQSSFFKGVIAQETINKIYTSVHFTTLVVFSYRIRAIDSAGNGQVTEFYDVEVYKPVADRDPLC
ncbi:MAG: right-handed parallel beta-helix repeat-containing protein [Candidatus Thermoplasmatota archaeon]|nr:right-handed parallel beta-helix repeat-containing protein [Candidatus Thermoplasmatota archaeon]